MTFGGSYKSLFAWIYEERLAQTSLAACILRDGLRTLANGVLCQFSGQEQPDSRLNLAGTDGGLLVVVG